MIEKLIWMYFLRCNLRWVFEVLFKSRLYNLLCPHQSHNCIIFYHHQGTMHNGCILTTKMNRLPSRSSLTSLAVFSPSTRSCRSISLDLSCALRSLALTMQPILFARVLKHNWIILNNTNIHQLLQLVVFYSFSRFAFVRPQWRPHPRTSYSRSTQYITSSIKRQK